jgi:hypothetical protein
MAGVMEIRCEIFEVHALRCNQYLRLLIGRGGLADYVSRIL